MGRNDFLVKLEEEIEKQSGEILEDSVEENKNLENISTIKISMEGDEQSENSESSIENSENDPNKSVDFSNFQVSDNKQTDIPDDKIEPINVIGQIVDNGAGIKENIEDETVMMEIFKKNRIKKEKRKTILIAVSILAGVLVIGGVGFGVYQNKDMLNSLYGNIVAGNSLQASVDDTRLKDLERQNAELNTQINQLMNNAGVSTGLVQMSGAEDLSGKNKILEDKKLELLADIEVLKKENQQLRELSGKNMINSGKIEELIKKNNILEQSNSDLKINIKSLESELGKIKSQNTGNVQTGIMISIDSLKNVEVKDFYDFYRKDIDFIRGLTGSEEDMKKYIIRINLLVASWDKNELTYDKFRVQYNQLISEIISKFK